MNYVAQNGEIIINLTKIKYNLHYYIMINTLSNYYGLDTK